jgi:hypothetical protein
MPGSDVRQITEACSVPFNQFSSHDDVVLCVIDASGPAFFKR